jgi:hypothetical protein
MKWGISVLKPPHGSAAAICGYDPERDKLALLAFDLDAEAPVPTPHQPVADDAPVGLFAP